MSDVWQNYVLAVTAANTYVARHIVTGIARAVYGSYTLAVTATNPNAPRHGVTGTSARYRASGLADLLRKFIISNCSAL